jgi:hypothetical protein
VRLSTARGFARYLTAFDPSTEVPPVGLLPEPSHRAVPYIYSEEDIAKVVRAACQRSSNSLDVRHGVQVIPYPGVQVIPYLPG